MPHTSKRKKQYTAIPTSVTHTIEGRAISQKLIINALYHRYNALRYAMFEWSDSSGKCDEMFDISCGTAPECIIVDSWRSAFFDYEGSTYCLPIVQNLIPNIYGQPVTWRVETYGNDILGKELNKVPMNYKNSVLCIDSLHQTQERDIINNFVLQMVDTMSTLYGRTLLARAPYLLSVQGMQDSKATNYMNAILNGSPFIIQGQNNVHPELMQAPVNIDTGLLDILSFYDAQILGYIGYDATDVYKRAQMSISETNMSQSKIGIRRREKLKCRQRLCDSYNKKFGNKLKVISVLDDYGQPDVPPLFGDNYGTMDARNDATSV